VAKGEGARQSTILGLKTRIQKESTRPACAKTLNSPWPVKASKVTRRTLLCSCVRFVESEANQEAIQNHMEIYILSGRDAHNVNIVCLFFKALVCPKSDSILFSIRILRETQFAGKFGI
jgi:hypothetical protein